MIPEKRKDGLVKVSFWGKTFLWYGYMNDVMVGSLLIFFAQLCNQHPYIYIYFTDPTSASQQN